MGEETLASTTNNAMMANELNTLIRLNFDAIEAYTAAIERLENADYRQALTEFRADHARHVEELKELVHWMGAAPAKTGDTLQILTKGKVALGNLRGDKGILQAMKSNEDHTNEVYEKEIGKLRYSQDMADVLKYHLDDERRHRDWLVQTLATLH